MVSQSSIPTLSSHPQKSKLHALILAPTRELTLQVSFHLKIFLYASNSEPTTKDESKTSACQYQYSNYSRRDAHPKTVLVATPGRLWDVLEDVSIYRRY